ncbi:copper resistance CopC/CopD family protein [Streptomyces sp. NPDC002573]|uniref:copper resistance CopC/CopD family protein n=1 Tax=Streptomyces sp. NPDC002573 TaxID=3364651 RepID=UPI00369A494B
MGAARVQGRSPGAGGRRGGFRRLALLLVVVPLVLLAGGGSASAHAALKGTDPADGTVLKTAPKAVTLTFSESVGLLDNSIRVLDPGNRRVHTGSPEHADGRSDTARVTLPHLPDGTYIVAWRVVSADSHPVNGALTFSVGKPSVTTAVVTGDEAQDAASAALYDIARYVAYGGLALVLGITVFAMATGVNGARGLLVGGWWTLLGATCALLLLRGPYERGSGPAAVFDLSALGETVTSRPGLALLARLVVLGLAAVVVGRSGPAPRGRLRFAIVSVLAVVLTLTWAVSEHASAGIQVPVAMTSAVLHLLAMAVWLGGLAALLTLLYREPEELPARAVARFSRLAFAAVAVLVATGVYQSWRGLGSLDALTSTVYGRLLTAKLVAVVLLLTAAAYSRRWTARLAIPAARVPVPERAREPVAAGGGPARPKAPHEDVHGTPDTGRDGKSGAVPAGGDTEAVAADRDDGGDADGGVETDRGADGGRTDQDPDPDGVRGGDGPPDPGPQRRALRRSVLAEVTVGIVVLVLSTLLSGTQPGRAATEAAASTAAADESLGSTMELPFDVGTAGGRGKVQIELTPARAGENAVQAVVYGPDGGIATVPELRLTFTFKARNLGPLDAGLTDRGGYWAADVLNLPLRGAWTMKATIRTSDIDQVTVSRTVTIG